MMNTKIAMIMATITTTTIIMAIIIKIQIVTITMDTITDRHIGINSGRDVITATAKKKEKKIMNSNHPGGVSIIFCIDVMHVYCD